MKNAKKWLFYYLNYGIVVMAFSNTHNKDLDAKCPSGGV